MYYGILNASAYVVSAPKVAAIRIDGRVPLTELSESDTTSILLNHSAALTISNLVVCLAVLG
jgi:hypothetical protein